MDKTGGLWLAPLLLLALAVLVVFGLVAAMTGEWDVAVLDFTFAAVIAWPALRQ